MEDLMSGRAGSVVGDDRKAVQGFVRVIREAQLAPDAAVGEVDFKYRARSNPDQQPFGADLSQAAYPFGGERDLVQQAPCARFADHKRLALRGDCDAAVVEELAIVVRTQGGITGQYAEIAQTWSREPNDIRGAAMRPIVELAPESPHAMGFETGCGKQSPQASMQQVLRANLPEMNDHAAVGLALNAVQMGPVQVAGKVLAIVVVEVQRRDIDFKPAHQFWCV